MARGERLATLRELVGRRNRKWIDARIEQLDPDADYLEIVRLSTIYDLNDLQLHWFYSVGTPAAGIAPNVIDAVYRHGTGKYMTAAPKRRDDSVDHMLEWLEHGPDAEPAQRSVDMVNRYHATYARDFPSGFSDPVDYVYILCLNATLVEVATRSLGLRGLSDRQQRAMHKLWIGIADRFTMPDGRSVTDLESFPTSFEGMVDYVESYQARPWPVHEPGHISTEAEIEHFATTWFPRPLHFFGRALVTAFLSPHVVRAHAIDAPPSVLAWAARRLMKTMMFLTAEVLPDARTTYPDRKRELASVGKCPRSAVDVAVHRPARGQRVEGAAAASLCPHVAAVGK